MLTGLVERVTYQNVENGFCVVRIKARGHRELVTLVGHAAAISAGEWITASGNWINDRTHGQQFKARFLKTSAPTSLEGIEKYLASGMIRGIGPGRNTIFAAAKRNALNSPRLYRVSIASAALYKRRRARGASRCCEESVPWRMEQEKRRRTAPGDRRLRRI